MISPEALRRHPAFANLTPDDLKSIAAISEEREYEGGCVIFEEREPADHLFMIVKGEVDIFATLGTGRLSIVGTLIAGDLMLLSSVIPPHETRFGSRTRGPTKLIAIRSGPLRDFLEEHPSAGYHLLQRIVEAMSERLDGTRVQLAATA